MSESGQPPIDLSRKALSLRNRAEELRTAGETTRSDQARRILLNLAREADEAARRIEEALKQAQN